MEEKYRDFESFDWSDERWITYFDGLYPTPTNRQLLKFKKKWYKRNVDQTFDDSYDPHGASSGGSGDVAGSGGSGRGSSSPPPSGTSPSSPESEAHIPRTSYSDGGKWGSMGRKATICFVAHGGALVATLASFVTLIDPTRALQMLTGACIVELVCKHGGIKFKAEYLRAVLLEDCGMSPLITMALLLPGLHRGIALMALGPPAITSMLSFAQICKSHSGVPGRLRDIFSPLSDISVRYELMQHRSDGEVLLGVVLIGAVFMGLAVLMAPLLFWNMLMMRYRMSAWTQASFRKIDGIFNPVLGRIPLINKSYDGLKNMLYSLVDPAQEPRRSCSVL
eukprot:TRINITY_DN71804_c0_g1_i1.p1 TRINITY_DN71804_c0_g1~~TRINITY_DN71804_c0_g1_i1.p1  ORF type:complete len:361 (+),score=65.37 TRINITY_DN71804_c0_g1_i1:78-1085(+)